MRPYPRDVTERVKARKEILDRQIRAAHREASQIGRAANCLIGEHRPGEGCRNKGDGCLCECHDVVEAS